jgi:hypothetical protein
MACAKLVVIYPRPKDIASFEHVYLNEHVPMAVAGLSWGGFCSSIRR